MRRKADPEAQDRLCGGKADARGRFKIKLKPGDNDLGDIKVSASSLKK